MTKYLAGILTGIFIACAGKYLADKYTDKRRGMEKKRAGDSDLQYVTDKMPELIAEMRDDLTTNPLCREFILFSKRGSYNHNPNKKILSYFFEDHDNLREKVGILENLGFVDDITFNDTHRYCMSEHFAELLRLAI